MTQNKGRQMRKTELFNNKKNKTRSIRTVANDTHSLFCFIFFKKKGTQFFKCFYNLKCAKRKRERTILLYKNLLLNIFRILNVNPRATFFHFFFLLLLPK